MGSFCHKFSLIYGIDTETIFQSDLNTSVKVTFAELAHAGLGEIAAEVGLEEEGSLIVHGFVIAFLVDFPDFLDSSDGSKALGNFHHRFLLLHSQHVPLYHFIPVPLKLHPLIHKVYTSVPLHPLHLLSLSLRLVLFLLIIDYFFHLLVFLYSLEIFCIFTIQMHVLSRNDCQVLSTIREPNFFEILRLPFLFLSR